MIDAIIARGEPRSARSASDTGAEATSSAAATMVSSRCWTMWTGSRSPS
jgi:hypothetical protein